MTVKVKEIHRDESGLQVTVIAEHENVISITEVDNTVFLCAADGTHLYSNDHRFSLS